LATIENPNIEGKFLFFFIAFFRSQAAGDEGSIRLGGFGFQTRIHEALTVDLDFLDSMEP
jgi:hypothetical protein